MISVTVQNRGEGEIIAGMMEELAEQMRRALHGFRCPTHGDETKISVVVKPDGWEIECCCELAEAEVERVIPGE